MNIVYNAYRLIIFYNISFIEIKTENWMKKIDF